MADINIRQEFLSLSPESSNKEFTGEYVQQVRSITSNIVSSALVGEVIFQFNTGGSWCDLFKTFLTLKYTTSSITDYAELDNLASCIFDRGQLYLNGKRVCGTNNWTSDSILSKRIQFGPTYNKSINDIRYDALAAGSNYPGAAAGYTSTEFLDALFLRSPDMLIPPNTDVKLICSPASSSGLYKSLRGDASDTAITLAINDLYLTTHFVNKPSPPEDYVLKFVTLESFKNSVSSASFNQQIACKDSLVRLAAHCVDSTSENATATIIYNSVAFRYETDGMNGATATDKLNTLQFKAGNQVLPLKEFDNATYGFRDSYIHFINACQKSLDPSGCETQTEYETQGVIYTMPVVHSSSDPIRHVELNAVFAAQPTAFMFLTCFYEQMIRFQYRQGVLVDTQVLL